MTLITKTMCVKMVMMPSMMMTMTMTMTMTITIMLTMMKMRKDGGRDSQEKEGWCKQANEELGGIT